MFKHLKNILLLGTIVLLLSACATTTTQPTAVPTEKAALTSTPIVLVVTATSMPETATVKAVNTKVPAATNTPMPKITFTPSIPGAYDKDGKPISSKSSIIITSVKETGAGQAQINWMATGTFSSGFRIYYSSTIVNPVMGGEKSEYAIPDGLARSAFITGTPGTTYYYRLCSFTGSACDFYSNSFSYTFLAATSTP
jgi:hypothetical protein